MGMWSDHQFNGQLYCYPKARTSAEMVTWATGLMALLWEHGLGISKQFYPSGTTWTYTGTVVPESLIAYYTRSYESGSLEFTIDTPGNALSLIILKESPSVAIIALSELRWPLTEYEVEPVPPFTVYMATNQHYY